MATELATQDEIGGTGTRLVAFRLGKRAFGLPLLQVREVVALGPIMPIPQAAPKIRGAVNLGGRFAVVIDLRAALGVPAGGAPATEVGLVVEHDGYVYVLLVDTVDELAEAPPAGAVIETLDVAALVAG